MNPLIIVAIIIQAVIAKASKVAGAIVGYLITTGILLWGLSLYGSGDEIAFAGIPLSQPVFFVVVLIWYAFDTGNLIAALSAPAQKTVPARHKERTDEALEQLLAPPAAPEQPVVRFACPGCHGKLKAPEMAAGKTIRCPACGVTFMVPQRRVEAGCSTVQPITV
jgi:hypothetical protein